MTTGMNGLMRFQERKDNFFFRVWNFCATFRRLLLMYQFRFIQARLNVFVFFNLEASWLWSGFYSMRSLNDIKRHSRVWDDLAWSRWSMAGCLMRPGRRLWLHWDEDRLRRSPSVPDTSIVHTRVICTSWLGWSVITSPGPGLNDKLGTGTFRMIKSSQSSFGSEWLSLKWGFQTWKINIHTKTYPLTSLYRAWLLQPASLELFLERLSYLSLLSSLSWVPSLELFLLSNLEHSLLGPLSRALSHELTPLSTLSSLS